MSPELGGEARSGSGRVLARVGPTLILWCDWKGELYAFCNLCCVCHYESWVCDPNYLFEKATWSDASVRVSGFDDGESLTATEPGRRWQRDASAMEHCFPESFQRQALVMFGLKEMVSPRLNSDPRRRMRTLGEIQGQRGSLSLARALSNSHEPIGLAPC